MHQALSKDFGDSLVDDTFTRGDLMCASKPENEPRVEESSLRSRRHDLNSRDSLGVSEVSSQATDSTAHARNA